MNAMDLDRAAAVSSPSSRRASYVENVISDFRSLIDGKLAQGAGNLDVINPGSAGQAAEV
jgi:hypothetical protein